VSRPARFSARARQEIAEVITGIEHASAARKLREALATAARRIGQHPDLGYRSDTSPPSILRFVHAARDLPPLLVELRPPAESQQN